MMQGNSVQIFVQMLRFDVRHMHSAMVKMQQFCVYCLFVEKKNQYHLPLAEVFLGTFPELNESSFLYYNMTTTFVKNNRHFATEEIFFKDHLRSLSVYYS